MAGAATVEKALDVLFHLHDVGVAVGLSDIGRALDLPKSSCHRLLSSLANRDVVERDEAGRYRPGLALLSLGLGAQRRDPVVAAARSALEAEVSVLGETVFLVGLRHEKLCVLDKVEGPGFLRAAPGVGDIVPADVTAAGKLYAVFAGAGAGREVPSALHEGEAREIAARGYALNRGGWIDGLSVLAAPVWQKSRHGTSELVGVIALAAASPHFDRLGEERIADRLRQAAASVSERLSATSVARRHDRLDAASAPAATSARAEQHDARRKEGGKR